MMRLFCRGSLCIRLRARQVADPEQGSFFHTADEIRLIHQPAGKRCRLQTTRPVSYPDVPVFHARTESPNLLDRLPVAAQSNANRKKLFPYIDPAQFSTFTSSMAPLWKRSRRLVFTLSRGLKHHRSSNLRRPDHFPTGWFPPFSSSAISLLGAIFKSKTYGSQA